MSVNDLRDSSLVDLFRQDAEIQLRVLTSGLLALEREHHAEELDACMRAAHSLKGAARMVELETIVRMAHVMEDCFVAAQKGQLALGRPHIDLLLSGVDLLTQLASPTALDGHASILDPLSRQANAWLSAAASVVSAGSPVDIERAASAPVSVQAVSSPLIVPDVPAATAVAMPAARTLNVPAPRTTAPPIASRPTPRPSPAVAPPTTVTTTEMTTEPMPPAHPAAADASDRMLRVTADTLNRLLGLAGESLVETRWVSPFVESLRRLKRLHEEANTSFDELRETLTEHIVDDETQADLSATRQKLLECSQLLSQRLDELEMFDRRSVNLSRRLYDEALACRMRPFADAVQTVPRMVRDLARSLDKDVRLEIAGDATQVDRDILAKLDAPLGHLLRNAVDHGIETRDERRAAGKPAEALIRLEARHSAGALQISVADDGRGVDLVRLREVVVARRLTSADAARVLSEPELLEFLFLPGFTMKETLTDVSGRGVGLDVVRDAVKQMRGTVRVSSRRGQGTRFQLQLPVTLSVVRALLVEIAGEAYAFPLVAIVRTLKLPRERIESLEGRQHFDLDGHRVGLVSARQVLESTDTAPVADVLPVVVIGDAHHAYGVIVDRLLDERELVVQPLDAQLGKIKDIAAGALMENGAPVLIVDTEDFLQSIDKIAGGGRLTSVGQAAAAKAGKPRKRVLVVDDSLTVRELERKLLTAKGYDVHVAVDGMDGWNAVRTGQFSLVVTDIDMPRMDGIELVTLIKKDPQLGHLPVMVVSYKDRDEDRRRGLEAGAAYYLTKSSFHDETLVQAVVDLIGEAEA